MQKFNTIAFPILFSGWQSNAYSVGLQHELLLFGVWRQPPGELGLGDPGGHPIGGQFRRQPPIGCDIRLRDPRAHAVGDQIRRDGPHGVLGGRGGPQEARRGRLRRDDGGRLHLVDNRGRYGAGPAADARGEDLLETLGLGDLLDALEVLDQTCQRLGEYFQIWEGRWLP